MESRGVFTFFTIGFLLVGLLCIALILAALRHDSSEIYAQMGSSSDMVTTSFAVIAPKEGAVGEEITVTITAIDKDGNAVPSYIGTVNIETNLPDFPNKMTFSAGDFGRQQTKVVVGSTGEFTIKVYDATRDIRGESAITVKEASELAPTDETEQATPEETTPENTPEETTPSSSPPEATPPSSGEIPPPPTEEPLAPSETSQ